MPDLNRKVPQELATLSRLAEVHAGWAANQPHVTPAEGRDITRQFPDVERLLILQSDPLLALLRAELAIVGWRIYTRGGCLLMNQVYLRIERDRHPSFAGQLSDAWHGIGYPDKPLGMWNATRLL